MNCIWKCIIKGLHFEYGKCCWWAIVFRRLVIIRGEICTFVSGRRGSVLFLFPRLGMPSYLMVTYPDFCVFNLCSISIKLTGRWTYNSLRYFFAAPFAFSASLFEKRKEYRKTLLVFQHHNCMILLPRVLTVVIGFSSMVNVLL